MPAEPNTDPWVTSAKLPRLALRDQEMAEAVGVSVRTLANWRDTEELPYIKVGGPNGTTLYPVAAVRRWLRARTVTQTPAK